MPRTTYSITRTVWETVTSPDASSETIIQEIVFNLSDLTKLRRLAEKDINAALTKAQEKAIRDYLAAP